MDSDVARRMQVLRTLSWSFLGGVVGGLLGVLGRTQGAWGIDMIVKLALVSWAICFLVPLVVSSVSGRAARVLHAPSGRTTPRLPGYSQAESLAARGLHEDAIAAYRAVLARDPDDPTPYIRIARIYRDRLARNDEAARWFKDGLRAGRQTARSLTFGRRELVELYVSRMQQPAKAAPILARMAEELADAEEGAWARAELARIKAEMADEAPGG